MSPEEKANIEKAFSTLAELARVNSKRMNKSKRQAESSTQAPKELTEEKKLLIRAQEQLAEIQNAASPPNLS
ncbi:MAG TPA: hypothetical protein VGO69_06765 [Pyrinomonadaceae bacterium]|nr:hypothetical protein [Pyrinomonadaceae bacterium]